MDSPRPRRSSRNRPLPPTRRTRRRLPPRRVRRPLAALLLVLTSCTEPAPGDAASGSAASADATSADTASGSATSADAASGSAASAAAVAADLSAAIDALVTEAVDRGVLAGAAVAVLRGGEPLHVGHYGWADLETRTPVGPETLFNMESTTKPFTGAALAALASEGRLDLDDPLQQWIPEFPNPDQGARITLRQLVNHTSGLSDYIDADLERWLETREPLAPAVVLDYLAGRPLDFEPGTHWAYTNAGFYLAGMVIERASGQPWFDVVRDRFLTPGELDDLHLCDDAPVARRTTGYIGTDSTLAVDPLFREEGIRADGGLCASALTLARAASVLESEVGLGPGFPTVRTPTRLTNGVAIDYGMGLRSGTLAGHALYGHTGGISGYLAVMARFPDDDVSIAVLINTNRTPADALVLFGPIAARALGVDVVTPPERPLSDAVAAAYVGRYRGAPGEGLVEVTTADGRLRVTVAGAESSTELIAVGEHTFARADGSYPLDRFVFQMHEGVAAAYAGYYNGMHQTFRQRLP